MKKIWFTSDWHFGHKNILAYGPRPEFTDLHDMNKSLIKLWNNTVSEEDEVWFLGDFAFTKSPEQYFETLKGHKNLVVGNHDNSRTRRLPWQLVRDYVELTIDGQMIVMSHYPMVTWHKAHHGSWMLHGHCHGGIDHMNTGTRLDVGYDARKGHSTHAQLLEFSDLQELFAERKYVPVDHHVQGRD